MATDLPEHPATGNDLDRLSQAEKACILIIDDDQDYVTMMKLILRQADFDVSSSQDLATALRRCAELKPDLILLDLMMPDMDGYDVFCSLRQVTSAPVIIISAAPREHHLARALDLGTDDYISKPFETAEVIARIRRVLRQSRRSEQAALHYFPDLDLRIDLTAHEVTLRGKTLRLLPREYALLRELAERAPRNVPYDTLTTSMWGEDSARTRAHLKAVAFSLRQKLEAAGLAGDVLVNNRGVGYQFVTKLTV